MGDGEDLTGFVGWQWFVSRLCMGKVAACVGWRGKLSGREVVVVRGKKT